MDLPFTNVHTHVFNSECAPDRFLRILPVKAVRWFPGVIKWTIDSVIGRAIIHTGAKIYKYIDKNKRSEIDKYFAFLDVGTDATQLQIFEAALEAGKKIEPSVRIVGLTMNMDYMDSQPSKKQISYLTQLAHVKDIKRYYPTQFFPFLGVDARQGTAEQLVNWAKPYFESGVVTNDAKVFPYFSGIKLYPALGFFPFDPRLENLYAYAEKNQLPVMTHCTRVGSQYIGDQIEGLIPDDPPMIACQNEPVKKSIKDRIVAYKDKSRNWIKNSKIGNNDLACDLFGHPENYIPVLEKFPNLKICLAHLGGSNEVIKSSDGDLAAIRKVDQTSWFEHIEAMMKKYPSLYTDVSYTLSDFNSGNKVLKAVLNFLDAPVDPAKPQGERMGDRVLFGTDFFMTEQERREPELYSISKQHLGTWWDKIGRVNTQKFLMQPL